MRTGYARLGRSNQHTRRATTDTGSHLIIEGEDDDEQSDLVLIYNTIRGYVSAVKEL